MDSPLSSAISISSVPSDGLDINQRESGAPLTHPSSLVLDLNGKQLFDSGDGDMELVVNGIRFETHRYLIKRFKKWSNTSPKLRPGSVMTITGTASSEDFSRMLKVLYATTLEGPFEFDASTLVSALHVATEYEYPALRDYAIRHLEQAELTAIKRIDIARKLGLPSWEKPAYMELCKRDETITEEEANILGMAAFVRVAKIREKELRRRGKGVDTECEEGVTRLEGPKIENITKQRTTWIPLSGDEEPSKENSPRANGPRKTNGKNGKWPTNLGVRRPGAQSQPTTPETPRPSFVGVPTTDNYRPSEYTSTGWEQHGLPVPGCSCRYGGYAERCVLPACAASAFKNLQVEQLAHTKTIASLQSSMDELQVALKSEPSTSDHQVNPQDPTHLSMDEDVRVMLSELSLLGSEIGSLGVSV